MAATKNPIPSRRAKLFSDLAGLAEKQGRLFLAASAVLAELAALEDDRAAPPVRKRARVPPLRTPPIDPSIVVTERDMAHARKARRRYGL